MVKVHQIGKWGHDDNSDKSSSKACESENGDYDEAMDWDEQLNDQELEEAVQGMDEQPPMWTRRTSH